MGTTRWNRVGTPSSPEHAIGDKRAPLPRGPFRRYAADLRTRVRGGVIRASAGKSGHRDTDANVPKATLGPPSIGVRMPRTLPFFGVVPRFTLRRHHECKRGDQTRDDADREPREKRSCVRSQTSLYNNIRTHRSLDKDALVTRPVQRTGRIKIALHSRRSLCNAATCWSFSDTGLITFAIAIASVTGHESIPPLARYPFAGVVLLYGVGARPPPDRVREDRSTNLGFAWSEPRA